MTTAKNTTTAKFYTSFSALFKSIGDLLGF